MNRYTIHGDLVDIPGDLDMLVAGTSCVDFSSLNTRKQSTFNFPEAPAEGEVDNDESKRKWLAEASHFLRNSGMVDQSSKTFLALLVYVYDRRPKVVILENVYSAPWESVKNTLARFDYSSKYVPVDSKKFGVPQTRNRQYLLAVDRYCVGGEDTCESILAMWAALLETLMVPDHIRIEEFLADPTDPTLQGYRRAMEQQKGTRFDPSDTDWEHGKIRHERVRQREGFGDAHPITCMGEGRGVVPYDQSWQLVQRQECERVLDAQDIVWLRQMMKGIPESFREPALLALRRLGVLVTPLNTGLPNFDLRFKAAVVDFSQNVDRTENFHYGRSGCVTPGGHPVITLYWRPVLGIEALALQGIERHSIILSNETDRQLRDLAGNAMTTTAVGAIILSTIISFQTHATITAKFRETHLAAMAPPTDLRHEMDEAAAMDLVREYSDFRSPRSAIPITIPGMVVPNLEDLPWKLPTLLNFCVLNTFSHTARTPRDIISDDLPRIRQLCVCDGASLSSQYSKILQCKVCGTTRCAGCAGNPQHNFIPTTLGKFRPSTSRIADQCSIAQYFPSTFTIKGNFESPIADTDDRCDTFGRFVNKALRTLPGETFVLEDVKIRESVTLLYVSGRMRASVAVRERGITWYIEVDCEHLLDDSFAEQLTPEQIVYLHAIRTPDRVAILRAELPLSHKSAVPAAESPAKWEVLDPGAIRRLPFRIEMDRKAMSLGIRSSIRDLQTYTDTYLSSDNGSTLMENATLAIGAYERVVFCESAENSLCVQAEDMSQNPVKKALFAFKDPSTSRAPENDCFVIARDCQRLGPREKRDALFYFELPENGWAIAPHRGYKNRHILHGQFIFLDAFPCRKVGDSIFVAPADTPSFASRTSALDVVTPCTHKLQPSIQLATHTPPHVSKSTISPWGHDVVKFDKITWHVLQSREFGKLRELIYPLLPRLHGPHDSIANSLTIKYPECRIPMSHFFTTTPCDSRQCCPIQPTIDLRHDTGFASLCEISVPITNDDDVGHAAKLMPLTVYVNHNDKDQMTMVRFSANFAALGHRAIRKFPPRRFMEGTPVEVTGELVVRKPLDNVRLQVFKIMKSPSTLSNAATYDKVLFFKPGMALHEWQQPVVDWMIRQEEPRLVSEHQWAEARIEEIGVHAFAKATIKKEIAGGIVAHDVGFGKTVIALALLSYQFVTDRNLEHRKVASTARHIKATLVIVPEHILEQWAKEIYRFLCYPGSPDGRPTVLKIRSPKDLMGMAPSALSNADIVLVSHKAFGISYLNLLAKQFLPEATNACIRWQHMSRRAMEIMYEKILVQVRDRVTAWSGKGFTNKSLQDILTPISHTNARNATKTYFVALEMFGFARVIYDEFSYDNRVISLVLEHLQSQAKWILSGTPPLRNIGEVADTGRLLGARIVTENYPLAVGAPPVATYAYEGWRTGREYEAPKDLDLVGSEKVTRYASTCSQELLISRHTAGQQFVSDFYRTQETKTDVMVTEKVILVDPNPADLLAYLVLQQRLASADFRVDSIADNFWAGGYRGAHQAALAAVASPACAALAYQVTTATREPSRQTNEFVLSLTKGRVRVAREMYRLGRCMKYVADGLLYLRHMLDDFSTSQADRQARLEEVAAKIERFFYRREIVKFRHDTVQTSEDIWAILTGHQHFRIGATPEHYDYEKLEEYQMECIRRTITFDLERLWFDHTWQVDKYWQPEFMIHQIFDLTDEDIDRMTTRQFLDLYRQFEAVRFLSRATWAGEGAIRPHVHYSRPQELLGFWEKGMLTTVPIAIHRQAMKNLLAYYRREAAQPGWRDPGREYLARTVCGGPAYVAMLPFPHIKVTEKRRGTTVDLPTETANKKYQQLESLVESYVDASRRQRLIETALTLVRGHEYRCDDCKRFKPEDQVRVMLGHLHIYCTDCLEGQYFLTFRKPAQKGSCGATMVLPSVSCPLTRCNLPIVDQLRIFVPIDSPALTKPDRQKLAESLPRCHRCLGPISKDETHLARIMIACGHLHCPRCAERFDDLVKNKTCSADMCRQKIDGVINAGIISQYAAANVDEAILPSEFREKLYDDDEGNEDEEDDDSSHAQQVSSKMQAVAATIARIPADQKVVIFTQSAEQETECYRALAAHAISFEEHNINHAHDGHGCDSSDDEDTPTSNTVPSSTRMESFKTDDKQVLVLVQRSIESAGTNLQCARHVIFTSPLLASSAREYDMYMRQAIGRVVRPGQQNHVTIYHFAVAYSVEVDILELRMQKRIYGRRTVSAMQRAKDNVGAATEDQQQQPVIIGGEYEAVLKEPDPNSTNLPLATAPHYVEAAAETQKKRNEVADIAGNAIGDNDDDLEWKKSLLSSHQIMRVVAGGDWMRFAGQKND